jgi:BirA family biotin operon repressor/biotin-[acetyl-CoA-carboxylase] ligase
MAQALLVSLILKREHLPTNLAHLPMMAGAAAVRAIVSLAPELTEDIGLKWPNDIVLGEDLAHARKVGGILIETAFVRDQIDYAIIGTGINVNQAADALPDVPANALPPTSLRLEMGRMLDRTALLVALCQAWEELIVPQATPHDIYHEWRNLLLTLGQPVTVIAHSEGEHSFTGVAVDVTTDGALVVVDDAGHSHRLDAGDVSTRLP